MPETIKADPRYRKKLFISYATVLLALAALIYFILPGFLRYLRARELGEFLMITEICTLAFLLSFIGPAIFLVVTGIKIIRSGRMPYPGQKVIRDTKIITGSKATLRGKILVVLGILSIILAIAGSIVSHVYFEKFRHFNPFTSPTRVVWQPPPHIFS